MAERPGVAKIEEEMDSVELLAPTGWKKFVPKNSDIPKRNDVLFISPTGAEIRNRKQLAQFLRNHPGGPSASEFDWRYGGTPRRSSRITEKKKVVETPEEGPKSHKRKSNSNDHGTKHQKNGGVTEKEEKDEVPESEKTAAPAVEGIADAEMKDVVEDSSIKEQVGSAAKTIEDEIEVKAADQHSAEIQAGKNINEPEKLQPEDAPPPIIFAPEETSAVSENQELGVEEVGLGVPVLNEHEESKNENSNASEHHEESKNENSNASEHHEESKNENSFVSEHEEKQGVGEGSVLFVPEVTKEENVVIRENRVDSKASPRGAESSKDVLREKEVKDRAFLNDSRNWEQKTVSSS